ncbi:helix-turn-helix domain-containing protein [Qipengyuania sp. GH1]|uniref:helix-turn-helix domain-containing protein n=1 Tax=Qipengyuania aestuarii TaxID=2867241 RepID=UPI001C87B5CA|nr:helix-turn-helix domain-containing protein [Qipengyuania aestuarii]MBX7536650.1 helix-turn-helix domain-containing protein [Qipengyuania aestuarii]
MQTRTMPKRGPPRFARRSLDSSVGFRVRQQREAAGLSRIELAADAGIGPRTLARIERGDQLPAEKTLRRISHALQVSIGLLAPHWAADDLERIQAGTEHLGVGLRQIRKSQQISLAEAAAFAGISVSTLSRFERGFIGEGSLAKLRRADDRLVERLTFVSEPLAKLLGFETAAELTKACESITLD